MVVQMDVQIGVDTQEGEVAGSLVGTSVGVSAEKGVKQLLKQGLLRVWRLPDQLHPVQHWYLQVVLPTSSLQDPQGGGSWTLTGVDSSVLKGGPGWHEPRAQRQAQAGGVFFLLKRKPLVLLFSGLGRGGWACVCQSLSLSFSICLPERGQEGGDCVVSMGLLGSPLSVDPFV